MTPQTYPVKGMTCGGCARHVEKAARETPGVTGASVDLAAGTVTVTGDAEACDLAARVAEAGYELVRPA